MWKSISINLGFVFLIWIIGCKDKKSSDKIGFDDSSKTNQAQSFNTDTKNANFIDTNEVLFKYKLEGYSATELGIAVKEGNIIKIKDLIAKGVSYEMCLSNETYTFDMLYAALQFVKPEIVKFLISSKLFTSINQPYTEEGICPLILAANISDTVISNELANLLIENGAKVNGVGNLGFDYTLYPLIYAIKNNNEGLVKLLLDKGATKTISSPSGETALQIAETNGFNGIVTLLTNSN